MSENQPIEIDAGSLDIDLADVKRKSIKGVVALTTRTFLVYLVSIWATFYLTVLLSPSEYGTFFLVSAVINFLNYFSDIGLAAALIQKKETLTRKDLVTTFSIQQVLVLAIALLVFILTPVWRKMYSLENDGLLLLFSLTISLFLSSLKTIPTILLEKELKFEKLVIPNLLENLAFNFVAVFLAYKGFGITSFTVAVLVRGFLGLIAIYWVSPWKPGIGFSRKSLNHLLKFGLPYQGNSFLAMVKDDGMTLFLGSVIGQAGLGYIGWANKWVSLPLRFFLDNVNKVAFPAYAKIQSNQIALRSAVEKTVYFMALTTFPVFMLMGAAAPNMIQIVPRYEKWIPAMVPLYFYLVNGAWASVSTPLTNFLNAVGKIRITFFLMIMWTVLTWILMPFLGIRYGYQGVSAAAAIIAFSSIVPMIIVARMTGANFFKALYIPILGSALIPLVFYIFDRMTGNIFGIILVSVLSMATYSVFVAILDFRNLSRELFSFIGKSKNK